MNTSKIIRSANSSKYNFTPISNELFTNESISLETVALVCYLIHLPETWVIYKKHIEKVMDGRGCGGTKFRRIWKEAKDAGYIIQKKFRTKSGTYDYHYVVSDNILTTGTLSTRGSSTGGLSTCGKHTPITKNIEAKNIEEKNIYKDLDNNSTGKVGMNKLFTQSLPSSQEINSLDEILK